MRGVKERNNSNERDESVLLPKKEMYYRRGKEVCDGVKKRIKFKKRMKF